MYDSLLTFFQPGWVRIVVGLVYALSVCGIVYVILSENRNPLKSLAWISVLLLLPVAGVVLYVFFGRNIRHKRMLSRRNRKRLHHAETARAVSEVPVTMDDQTETADRISRLAKSLDNSVLHRADNLEIFSDGGSKFERLIADIAAARSYILLQYYIISDDALGCRVRDALVEASRRGVRVFVIYDHIGSLHTSRRFFNSMKREGIDIRPFFRVVFPLFATRINWRNHRKLTVIDGRIGYVGGMNIADRYVDGGRFDVWRDAHLRLTGPAVAALSRSFATDWSFMGGPLTDVLDLDMAQARDADDMPVSTPEPSVSAPVQLVTSGPVSDWSNVAFALQLAIARACKRVWIQTPYFLPTEGFLRALQIAALGRVDVRVMMPRRSDSAILTYASRSYIDECLRAGIRIYLYEAGMLHSKTVVIDDDICSIGSTNIDFRSFEHNFEANLLIYSREANERLSRIFVDDMRQSKRVRHSDWRKRPPLKKVAESVLRLLSPIL